MSQITLLKHQIDAIDFLLKKCVKQKGMIIYHTVGTGKTITALFFLKYYETKKRILIIPEELRVIWEIEAKKINMDITKVKIITYTNLEKKINKIDFSKYIVVCDEAHRISNIINNLELQKDKIKVLRSLQSSEKIILLTGTPIYNNLLDIRYLINISAGKDVVPYLDSEFRKKYLEATNSDVVTKGWFFPILKNYISLPINMIISGYTYFNKSIKDDTDIFLIARFIIFFISIIGFLYDKYHVYDIYKINVDKFTRDIKPYIDYYRPENNDSDFPSFEYEEIPIEYTKFQIELWLSIVNDTIKTNAIKQLEDTKNEIITTIINNEDDYLNKGRIIGNLSNPPKFVEILKKMKGFNSIVIYSNFYVKGILKFAEFLEDKKIKYTILDVSFSVKKINEILLDFKNKKINILLLHPKFIEGISIFGVQQLHILEPIIGASKKEQLIGRVIRYKSHTHLPLQYRKVFIYQYYCVVESIIKLVTKEAIYYKNWLKYYPGVYVDKMPERFNKNITPDGIVNGAGNQIQGFNNDFIKLLIKYKNSEICG